MEDFSSNESVNSILDIKVKEAKKTEHLEKFETSRTCCCRRVGSICWSLVLMVACLVVGFVGGMVFGDQKSRSDLDVALKEAHKAEPCVRQLINPNYTTVCSVCARTR